MRQIHTDPLPIHPQYCFLIDCVSEPVAESSVGQKVGKRQRTGALHDAVARSRGTGLRVSVLDCASPLALSVAVQGIKARNLLSADSLPVWRGEGRSEGIV